MTKLLIPPVLFVLRVCAKLKLFLTHPFIIGITGSVGKTTLTYLIGEVVSKKYQTKVTSKGNSETGLPLEILGLRALVDSPTPLSWLKVLFLSPIRAIYPPKFDFLVAEMGVDEPKEPKNMSYLLKIIRPKIGVFLNVAPVHTQQFISALDSPTDLMEQALQMIAREKGLLVTTLPEDGLAVINSDNKYIQKIIPEVKARKVLIGKKGDVRLKRFQLKDGSEFVIDCDGEHKINFTNQLFFEEFWYSLGCALAVAREVKIPVQEAITAIESFKPPPGRQSLIKGINGSSIIDSSYNSSTTALLPMLEMLGQLKGRKVAVLGDMRELGELAENQHRLAARAAVNCGLIATVGPLMQQFFVPELKKSGFPQDKIVSFKTSEGVGKFLAPQLKKGDFVLVKGSQNTIYLEQVVKEMMERPEQASKLLCRQTPFWEKVRKDFFTKNPQVKF